ncbi:hypothetical protein V8E54_003043 [Elaphomyces granulatus]
MPLTNENGIRLYMKAVVKFRERLLVVTHVGGGQPARGPELLSVRHTNTAGGGHRNICGSSDAASQGVQGYDERTGNSSVSASGGTDDFCILSSVGGQEPIDNSLLQRFLPESLKFCL